MARTQGGKMNIDKLNAVADIFYGLAHPIRLEILNFLEDGKSKTVGDILSKIQIEPTLLTHHLTRMKNSGILESSRKGRNVFYRLTIKEIKQIFSCIQNLSRKN